MDTRLDERLCDALTAHARNGIPDNIDLWPRLEQAAAAQCVAAVQGSVARRFRMPRIRWPWTTGISLVAAGAVALSLLLVPFSPRHESPLNPRAVLARALDAATHITPYRATVEIFAGLAQGLVPPLEATKRDLGTSRTVYQSVVRDATHWRVNVRVLAPVLRSDHEVAVANGRTVAWYESLTNRAAWYPLSTRRVGALLLTRFQNDPQGLPVLQVPLFGPPGQGLPPLLGSALPLEQTLQQWIRRLDNPQTGTHARVLGQQTVIGRTADVIEVWPLFRGYPDGTNCNPSHPSRVCLQDSIPAGRARFWIDHEYGIVLRYQQFPIPGVPSITPYRVTAITFGAGPTAAELAYRSPVRPVEVNLLSPTRLLPPGKGGRTWRVPAGFIAARPPPSTADMPYFGDFGPTLPGELGTGQTEALFLTANTPNQPDPRRARGSFLYIQEQRRVALPGALMAGTRWRAGTCIVYSGTYPDGIHWLALGRGHVSLLAVADALGERALVHWAATRVCPLR
jgi:hypothetical protein